MFASWVMLRLSMGSLTFDLSRETWVNLHSDSRVQRLAECYLAAYRARQTNAFIE